MYNKIIFKPPLTPETFRNENKPNWIKKKNIIAETICEDITPTSLNFNEQSSKSEEILLQNLSSHKNKRIFYNNFPYIRAMYRIGSRDFWQTYKVIKLGYYPSVSKFTRKISYQIPNNYEIETNLVGLTVRCKTQYQQTGNINYTISWVNSYGNTVSSDSTISASNVGVKFLTNICNKPNTRISGIFLFRFDIDCLHKARMESPNHGKHHYTELNLIYKKKKRIKLAAKDLNIQAAELFRNHQFVNLSGNNIVSLESAKLKIENKDITLDYQLKNENQEQYYSSLVRVCDNMLISCDGYRKLAAVDTNMVREYLVEKQHIDINNQMKQHLPLVLSIRSLLMVLVPVLTTSNPVVLRTGDKINIKIGGDGRNISKKQSHIILAISILNEGEAVLKNYDSLNCVYQKFTKELEELKGLNAANSNYFCLFCNCHENEHANMELNWNNGSNTRIIDQSNWIPDELYTMLHITDILFQCAFYEHSEDRKNFAKTTCQLIIAEMKQIGVHFEFFPPTTNSSPWTWTSLMGPDKIKILQHFQISKFFNLDRGKEIEHL
ncbi:hypothetical protein C2G38_2228955 [Gigaspora rosea]|uniref:Uncharacterized protein n=1 Tax=Gigaspora rosea TaxID=44941 RepID=A0A397U3Q0_9GLOM|nr:hypothetical protein C2G38_2228955 [Gigaspora rosea]